jgi:hypothetical protein
MAPVICLEQLTRWERVTAIDRSSMKRFVGRPKSFVVDSTFLDEDFPRNMVKCAIRNRSAKHNNDHHSGKFGVE